jgi:HEAT repeat protein
MERNAILCLTVAVLAGGARANDDTVGDLIQALRDPDAKVRQFAEKALIQADRKAVPALVKILECNDAALQARAAFILGRMGEVGRRHPESVVPLTALLESKKGEVRRQASWALSWITVALKEPPKELIPNLIRCLEDADERVCDYSRASLVNLDRAAVPALIELVKGKDGPKRFHAARALGTMGAMGRRFTEAKAALGEALKSDDVSIRRAAAYALSMIVVDP